MIWIDIWRNYPNQLRNKLASPIYEDREEIESFERETYDLLATWAREMGLKFYTLGYPGIFGYGQERDRPRRVSIHIERGFLSWVAEEVTDAYDYDVYISDILEDDGEHEVQDV